MKRTLPRWIAVAALGGVATLATLTGGPSEPPLAAVAQIHAEARAGSASISADAKIGEIETADLGPDATPALTATRRAGLDEVNRAVNWSMRPITDDASAAWSFSMVSADHAEHAAAKRALLLHRGWPMAAMRIARLRTNGAPMRAVLVVTTLEGRFVLDSAVDQARRIERVEGDWLGQGVGDGIGDGVGSANVATPRLWAALQGAA